MLAAEIARAESMYRALIVSMQCCAAGPQSAVRSTRGAVRGEGPPVLRVLRLNILWYLFI